MLDKDLMKVIQNRRSIRRFKRKAIRISDLKDIAKAGSYAASAGNRQLWHFIIVSKPEMVTGLFECVDWLKGAGEINASKSPSAYIVVLLNNPNNRWPIISDGAAAIQNMMLMSHTKGIGSCWIGSVKKSRVYKLLKVPERLSIYSILALGYPDENPSVEEVDLGNPEVYVNNIGKVIVQKRVLESVISINKFKNNFL